MPSLRDMQTRVVDALLDASPDDLAGLIRSDGMSPEARLAIHRNTLRSNFLGALRSAYPAVHRLVGEDYFRDVVAAYQRHHPSRSGDLNQAGESFADHLSRVHPDDEFRYLAEVARLEWLIQEALLAADHGPLDLQALGEVVPAAYDTLGFALHPTLRLFQSEFPALRIWEANVDEAEPPLMSLDEGGERVAILRLEGHLRLHRLTRGEYEFLACLSGGACFSASVHRASAADPDFDATLVLQRFVAAHAIVDFSLVQETGQASMQHSPMRSRL